MLFQSSVWTSTLAFGALFTSLSLTSLTPTQLTVEAPGVLEHRPPMDWPKHGAVVFDNYATRYREGLDLVLKGVSAEVRPREKVCQFNDDVDADDADADAGIVLMQIGIVGRTGAGKSSLTLALFRLIEATGGRVLIDGEVLLLLNTLHQS